MLRRRLPTRATTVAAEALLTLAAAAGAVCIVLVVAAMLFGVSVVLFATGSMSPTIPAGSAALVREVPAASLAIGDVVTVDRPGRLPITHRIVGIDGDDGEARRLTLRGDANPVDDPAPYEVVSAKLVLWSVPGIAPVIDAFGNPFVLGGLTVGATALVVWAFWPAKDRADHGSPRSPRHRGAASSIVGIGALLALPAGAVGIGADEPAAAATTETVVRGEFLRLVSIGDSERMERMSPGDTVTWEVGVVADALEPGTVVIELAGTGSAALGLEADLRSCPERWRDDLCPSPTTLFDDEPLPVDGARHRLDSMPSPSERWFRFDVHLPETTAEDGSGLVELRVHATGAGDAVSIDSPGVDRPARLGGTGPAAFAPLIAASGLAVGGGLMLLVRRSRGARR